MNKTKKKNEHYVNNADFLEAMKAYRKQVNIAKKERLPKIVTFSAINSQNTSLKLYLS